MQSKNEVNQMTGRMCTQRWFVLCVYIYNIYAVPVLLFLTMTVSNSQQANHDPHQVCLLLTM